MKKPTFFITGAPKCGTTSLVKWLSCHHNIFLPTKEIHWFNQDHGGGHVRSLEEYENLFEPAMDHHIAIGDASVWYLYSHVAINNIINYVEEPKFIVLIRNPLEMAVSLHSQLYYMAMENVHNFSDAWYLQEKRREGKLISSFCEDPAFLQYGHACLLGEQIERLYAAARKADVLILLLDDIKNNARKEYLKVLNFISVPDDRRVEFPVYNVAKEPRSFRLSQAIAMIAKAKQALGIRGGIGGLKLLTTINKRTNFQKQYDNSIRVEMAKYFNDDVRKLGDLIDRDLSHWLTI